MISEQELLQRARQFDLPTLGAIYDRYSPGLYRYAFHLLGHAESAEECVSEVFSRFLLVLRNGGGPREHLQAYLYRIAHNWVTDQWRRQPPPPLAWEERDDVDAQADPTQAVIAGWEQASVRAALVRLTPEQRQVVVLKFLEEWGNEEVAAALGKPVGAIKSLQHRALAALRRILLSDSEEEDRYAAT